MSILIYMDESGDTGMRKRPGHGEPSRYLTVACLVVSKTSEKSLERICKKLRQKMDKKAKKCDEIKSIHLTTKHREFIFKKLADLKKEDPHFAIHVRSVLKRDVWKPKLIANPNLVYNYITGKCISETLNQYDSIDFRIDNRNSKIKNIDVKYNLVGYLKKDIQKLNSKKIDIAFSDSRQHHGIQLADVLSNTVWRMYERGSLAADDYDCLKRHKIISTQTLVNF